MIYMKYTILIYYLHYTKLAKHIYFLYTYYFFILYYFFSLSTYIYFIDVG